MRWKEEKKSIHSQYTRVGSIYFHESKNSNHYNFVRFLIGNDLFDIRVFEDTYKLVQFRKGKNILEAWFIDGNKVKEKIIEILENNDLSFFIKRRYRKAEKFLKEIPFFA